MRKRKEEGRRLMRGRGSFVLSDVVMLGYFFFLVEVSEILLFGIVLVGMEYFVRLEGYS